MKIIIIHVHFASQQQSRHNRHKGLYHVLKCSNVLKVMKLCINNKTLDTIHVARCSKVKSKLFRF